MSKYSTLVKRVSNATAATALTLASLTPAVMLGGTAKAAQITDRSILMSDSEVSATSVSYTVNFTTPGVPTSVKISFCSNSPLPDDTCTAPTGMLTANAATSTTNWTIAGTTANTVTLDKASAALGAQSVVITGINNTSTLGSFYARIQSYDTAGASGSMVDFGGIALSTTNDLTINARVQETLTFCVGAADTVSIGTRTNCSSLPSDPVDLGIVGTTLTSSPVTSGGTTSGNEKNGFFVLATNAISGATVKYYGRTPLQVNGAVCNGSALNDQCFNNASGAGLVTAGTEGFGMYIKSIDRRGSAAGMTTATSPSATYDGRSATVSKKEKWSTSIDEIASASGPVDYDVAELGFHATASTPTPSGYYSTDANFIATATF